MSRIAIANLGGVAALNSREMRSTAGGRRICLRWVRIGRFRICRRWINLPILRVPLPKLPIPDPGPLAGGLKA